LILIIYINIEVFGIMVAYYVQSAIKGALLKHLKVKIRPIMDKNIK